ncbi:AfsR/SARP family transcriptional regulator [Glycomyces harbinensis]|uniref:DNA-binding transcriptional activator of the SARP family n=1 Tax=Glycomyces harbinensis TaxID=58114 RepID=A0A1G6ZP80_9ACTN|nr:BTAD domain-containing putative transcriptional regulator [Glycomyces harbinensis]SDE04017.1 DNA-binding transcriptional activator of the SARP family [Glycomyces harbinensis]
MGIQVFGRLKVVKDGRHVAFGGRLRDLLAILLVKANQVVDYEWLLDQLWSGDPPAAGRATLRTYVYQLRQRLTAMDADLVVVSDPDGYRLDVLPESVDAHRFECLAVEGGAALAAGRAAEAAAAFRAGLELCRGAAYDGVNAQVVRDRARYLDDLRLSVVEDRLDAELRLGNVHFAVSELQAFTAEHPFRERSWELLMHGLCWDGRRAEALQTYRYLHRLLDEQLGIPPSPDLQSLHQKILKAEIGLAPPTGTDTETIPRQLPPALGGFTGRETEVALLDALLRHQGGPHPGAAAIAAVTGTAGVGKTALTLHWAHRIADQFTDGQLYVDLRGFDPTRQPMDVATAVCGFLDALGVEPKRIPGDLEPQVGLYRSLLADKQTLIVLDNARDADQVRPLLPGGPDTFVVVTSRNQLPGLVATEGAQLIIVDLPSEDEAHQMLRSRVGDDRVSSEPQAAEDIVHACARLPLALALVGARAATHPNFRLSDLAAELHDAHNAFDAIASDERAVFSWSYHTLSPDAADLFRLLGLHPGPDIPVPVAASLMGRPRREVHRLLAEIAQANLATEHRPGRYALHDLLHVYAADLAERYDSSTSRREAAHRLLDHYLHSAHAAALLVDPGILDIALPLDQSVHGVDPEAFTDRETAMAWFAIEHPAVRAAAAQAAGSLDVQVWQSAWAPQRYFYLRGHWHELIATQQMALAAARRLGDAAAQAQSHRALARAHSRLGRFESSRTHLERALKLSIRADDPAAQAATHNNLGNLAQLQGRHSEALEQSRRALEIYQTVDHKFGEAHALNSIGWQLTVLGDHDEAHKHCEQALDLFLELGFRYGEAATCDSLGYIHSRLGRDAEGLSYYLRARAIFRELGDRFEEADTLSRLGDLYRSTGALDTAQEAWIQALAMLDDLGHPDAEAVRGRLRDASTQ